MLKIKKKDELFNYFDSINDLNTWIQSTPRRPSAESSSDRRGADNFCSTNSLKEAIHKMVYTDDELYKEFLEYKRQFKNNLDGKTKNKSKIINDYVGFTPNVPNYILGVPQDMIGNIPKPVTTKILNLGIVASVACACSSNQLHQLGLTVSTVIDNLEKQGYRCNLYLIYVVKCDNENSIFCLKLKSDSEPLNMKKLVFPLCSSGMFRRIGFYWIEASDMNNEATRWCYGRLLDDENYIKTKLNNILKLDVHIFMFQHNTDMTVDSFLKRLEDDGVVLC